MCTAVRGEAMARAVVMPYRCKGDFTKCEIYQKAVRRSKKAGTPAGNSKGLTGFLIGADDPPKGCKYFESGYCKLYDKFVPVDKQALCREGKGCPLKEKRSGERNLQIASLLRLRVNAGLHIRLRSRIIWHFTQLSGGFWPRPVFEL